MHATPPALIERHFDELLNNLESAFDGDVEGIHPARVATRLFRTPHRRRSGPRSRRYLKATLPDGMPTTRDGAIASSGLPMPARAWRTDIVDAGVEGSPRCGGRDPDAGHR